MFDLIKEAKDSNKAVVFENYMAPTITWDSIMLFLYKESVAGGVVSENLKETAKKINNPNFFSSLGNVQIQSQLWLSPQTHDIFEEFNDVSELLYGLNQSKDNSKCPYYQNQYHKCESDWHFQGMRISLSNRVVPDHHDRCDIFYWQILGTSFWKVNKDITYTLNPGDLLYLPKESSHEVWCDGPRAGLLIDNLN
jgi:mannose-6-phosphate isomerase-like protein (cupin superfamily)